MLRPLRSPAVFAAAATFLAPGGAAPLVPDHFESGAVHPVELSPDGTRLFVAHTADHRLVVFDLTPPLPTRVAEIQVGLEPVTVRARTGDEVWVVNPISDSISIVDVAAGRVVRTLVVGDEPTDVAFVPELHRAFVCVSQRDLLRVYDTRDLALPPVEIPLSMSDPRSLALSPDRETLYVAALDGQNETTVVPAGIVRLKPGALLPDPPMRPELPPAPVTGLIVRHDGAKWTDEAGRDWNGEVPYRLLDHDVLRIRTSTLAVEGAYTGVGTTLFNLAVHPGTGRIYATNQEASNEIRFEPNVRGRFLRNRVTTIDPGSGTVVARHLNEHIDYGNPAGDPGERALSLAIPTDVAVSQDGGAVYVAAFGSRRVGVLDADGAVVRRIVVGDGPCGLALDEPRGRLYVMNRFTSSLAVVALGPDTVVEIPLGFDPTPLPVRDGRRFLYDAEFSSAHGDLACASCHVFGGMDGIAWDLGDPQGEFIRSNHPPDLAGFHPMKGPMMTQSLKALPDTGPLHWRGDRPTFSDFNPAFVGLLGRPGTITSSQMGLFQAFVFAMRYPPSPNRYLDGTFARSFDDGNANRGEQLFTSGSLQNDTQCVDCHAFPAGTSGLIFPGGMLGESQDVKVPHLRNLAEKTRFDRTAAANVRGFGYTKDGSVDDLDSFLRIHRFTFRDDEERRDVEAFLLAFDSGTHPAVGAQVTMDGANDGARLARLETLAAMADADAVGLVAKGPDLADEARGWTYQGGGAWQPDRAAEPAVSTAGLLATAAAGRELTFTAVLGETAVRLGVDRDEDGWLDRDEIDAGSDPGDPDSTPGRASGAPFVLGAGSGPRVWHRGANPARRESRLAFSLDREGAARLVVYDLAGRRVRALVDEAHHPAGRFESAWDLTDERGRRVAPGTYFVRLETVQGSGRGRVVVLR